MKSINLSNIISLPVEERIKLVELIWDSLTEFPENIPLTEEQKQVLDKRLDRYSKTLRVISHERELINSRFQRAEKSERNIYLKF